MNEQEEKRLKLVVVGDMAVGKTALVQRFADDKFDDQHQTTVSVDFKQRDIRPVSPHDGDEPIRVNIWDTAGQERFRSLVSSYYRDADCIGIVYDTTRKATFEALPGWIENIEQNVSADEGANIPFVLIGAKCDLDQDTTLTDDTLRTFVKQNKRVDKRVFITSAKQDICVDDLFEHMATLAFTYRQQKQRGDTSTNVWLEKSKKKPSGGCAC